MFKALLVDDEPMAIEALKIAADWEKHGFIICGTCGNGEEALKMTKELHPDLIITDVRMPVMDGLELARLVSENIEPDVIVVIVSGYDDFDYAKKAMQFGIKHYILKPVFKDEFTGVLLQIIPDLKRKYELKKIGADTSKISISSWLDRYLSGELGEEALQDSLPFEYPQNTVRWTYVCLDTVQKWTDQFPNTASTVKNDQNSLRESLNNNLKDVYIYPVFAAAKLDGLIICSENDKTTEEVIGMLTKNVLKLFGDRFYMGVGNPVAELSQIKDSMSQAIAAIGYRFFNPPGSTILYKEIKDSSLNYSFREIEKIEALYTALESLDEKNTLDAVMLIFKEFCKEFTAPEIIKMYVVNIVYKSFSIIRSIGGSPDEIPLVSDITALLEKSTSIKEIEDKLKEYFSVFCTYAQSFKSNDKNSDMKIVEEYIKNNYTRNLTIREISSKLFIHPNYLGHQINKWFGCSFNEYLHSLRMEEAERLISDKELKVHEIAERLGYSTYNSFLEQFVKKFSMKPSDYRAKLNKKN